MTNSNGDIPRDVALAARQVAQLYSQTPQLLLANVILATLVAIVLADASGGLSYVWFTAIVIVSCARAALLLRFRRSKATDEDAALWGRRFTAGTGVAGATWGLGSAWLYLPGETHLEVFIAYVVAGIAAGAVKDAIVMVQESATAGRARIVSEVAEGYGWLQCDGRLLRQMLLVLLSHGVKFTPRNGILSLRVSGAEHGGCSVRVSDQGPTIPEADLRELMADFSDANSYLANVREGAAYSFSLAKSLAEIQGGRFEVKNVGERGISLYVTFPADRVHTA